MQTRNIVIAIVVLIIIALGLWWASASGITGSGTTASSTNQTASTTTSATSTNGSGSGSASSGTTLRTVASQTSNFTCTVTAGGTSGGQATGTIYGAGGKVRIDFSIPSNNGSVTSHIIRTGGYAYSWVDGQTTGTKTASSASTNITAPGQGGVISLDSATASECHAWSPDATQFVPPKGITFVAR